MPRVLFIGDLVGRPGRTFVSKNIDALKRHAGADILVANAENAAGGFGLTAPIAKELTEAGLDGLTLGNHIWDHAGFDQDIDHLERVCRPANLPDQCPGKPYLIIEKDGFRLGVITVLGTHFMNIKASCPFKKADDLMRELEGQVDAFLVEMHAETTAEKMGLGWFLDGRAALVVGTHTHVPTADGRILPRGTAYLTDAGMTGPYDSSIGCTIEPIIAKLQDGMPRRYVVASDNVQLWGCAVDIDPKTGLATHFESVCIKENDWGPAFV